MTRPTRTFATLLALLASTALGVGGASAQQTYQVQPYYPSPPAQHVPTTSYGTTTYQPAYTAPTGTVATQPHGGTVVYGTVPAQTQTQTQTYTAPVTAQTPIDDTVVYAPYYGPAQPAYAPAQPAYGRSTVAPAPTYRAPPRTTTAARIWNPAPAVPAQRAYVPPTSTGPQLGAPALIGGLIGAAVLGAVLIDRKKDRDRKRRRARDRDENQGVDRLRDRNIENARDRAERRRIRDQRAERERLEQEQRRAELQRIERERVEQQRLEQERAEQRRIRQERRRAEGGNAGRRDLTEEERAIRRARRQARSQNQEL